MKHWPVQDAKARFSELLRATLDEGPQMVTFRGRDAAVLVPAGEWERMKSRSPRSLKELLLAGGPDVDLPEPDWTGVKLRPPPSFDED